MCWGRGQLFTPKVRKETGPNPPLFSGHPLANRHLPPGQPHCPSAPGGPAQNCSSSQTTPQLPGGHPCAPASFPGELRHQPQHRSHLQASSTSQIKRQNQTRHKHKPRRDIPDVRGPEAPTGLWLPGMIHSYVIQEQGLEGPWGRGVEKYRDSSLPVGSQARQGQTQSLSFFFCFWFHIWSPLGLVPDAKPRLCSRPAPPHPPAGGRAPGWNVPDASGGDSRTESTRGDAWERQGRRTCSYDTVLSVAGPPCEL